MKPIKRFFLSLSCGMLCFILSLSFCPVSSFATTDTGSGTQSSVIGTDEGNTTTDTGTTPSRIQAAYSFDDASALAADVGGIYSLSTKEFGEDLIRSVSGYRNGGMQGYVRLDDVLFDSVSQFTMGFWSNFTLAEAQNKTTLFLVNGTDNESVELLFTTENDVLTLKLKLTDGYNTSICTYDVSSILSEKDQWTHIAFSYKMSGSVSLLTLYVNGKSIASSISADYSDLSRMKCDTATFYDITLDDLYFTDYSLDPGKIASLMRQSAGDFYASEQLEINEETTDPPDEPDISVPPVEKHNYSWAAYLFDGTFAAGTDYHSGDIPAAVDNSCVLIDTAKLTEKYGYAVIRRENSAPVSYLTLDSRLFSGHSSFTFSCWVYRNGKTLSNGECLLDLKGTGVIRFAPYAAEGDNAPSAYIEYTDSRGNTQHQTIKDGKPADPRNKWVHYALTVSESGDLTVYIDGGAVETFSSGMNLSTMALSECRVVTGASASDTTRTSVDEVYVTPKALSDAEIRKIHVYGLSRYTSEVLPDPGQTDTGDDPSNPYAPDAVDIAEDAYSQTGSISNGFIGTTFDERNNIGLDWNNSANATVTGGRLTQGVASYGLSLDGSSFVRYPAGILDGVESVTISLSYFWEGPGSDAARSQRLFDFSRKTSSVTDPDATIFLETGNGISGLRFGISDGISSTYLTYDYSAVNTWTRVTVVVSQGKVTLYLNDTVAATGYTDVDLTSICPNFCYLGRSGVKGDPMFTGIIDEAYISARPLSAEQVGPFMNGIAAAVNGDQESPIDVWGIVLTCTIIAAVVLVLVVIAVIIVIITKKEKKSSEDEAPMPVPITGAESPDLTVVGPRSARRAMISDPVEGASATVKLRKVGTEASPSSPPSEEEMTSKFRKITDEVPKSDENH